jgi:hypothetical protein
MVKYNRPARIGIVNGEERVTSARFWVIGVGGRVGAHEPISPVFSVANALANPALVDGPSL